MANFSNIGLQEPSTITNRVAAVTISRGSTAEQQEIMVLGDAESSNGIARILNVAPVSSDWGLVVRPVGASTTVNVSSVGGVVSVAQNSTVWATQSAQAGTWTVTIADGADVTEGAIADSAVTGDNPGTVNAHLRGLSKILADVWDSVAHYLKVSVQNTVTVSPLGPPAVAYDTTVGPSQTSTTDTYFNKVGGASGTTVQTITITYTDSTKTVLAKVEWT